MYMNISITLKFLDHQVLSLEMRISFYKCVLKTMVLTGHNNDL